MVYSGLRSHPNLTSAHSGVQSVTAILLDEVTILIMLKINSNFHTSAKKGPVTRPTKPFFLSTICCTSNSVKNRVANSSEKRDLLGAIVNLRSSF